MFLIFSFVILSMALAIAAYFSFQLSSPSAAVPVPFLTHSFDFSLVSALVSASSQDAPSPAHLPPSFRWLLVKVRKACSHMEVLSTFDPAKVNAGEIEERIETSLLRDGL
jgi:hypothetical protein